MDRLLSKIAAGGLSAGIFLLWWPEHVPGEGLAQLVVRGLLWTLAFELLLLAFLPLERAVQARLRRRMQVRRSRVRERIEAVPPPARTGGALALACMGVAAPLALLADAPHELVRADDRPRVVRQVIVKRPVVRREIVVRNVVGPAAVDAAAQARAGAQARAPRPPAASASARPRVVTRTRTVVRRVVREVPSAPPSPVRSGPQATEPAAPAPSTQPQTPAAPPAAMQP